MREVLEGRPEQGRADAEPAAPVRPRPGRAEVVLLTVAALTLVHLVDHVLRADASGWPFTRDLTWFTASLLVFPALVAAAALLVLVVGVDLAYGWAWASTDRSRLARTIVWQESDVSDYRRFPARPVPTRPPVFRFRRSPAADRLPVATVPVRQGGRLVERDLEGFLRSTGTTAFLAVKGDTLVSEVYFQGYRHDSTVSSFSVAKPVVSALVGIAIAQGRIGSVDDPVTRYLPELAHRDPRFGAITLRHLLTMSSGLADLDPYYDLDLDLRTVAVRDTRIAEPAGRRFHYNNVNPVLPGMVLERATGRHRVGLPLRAALGAAGHGGRRLLEPGQPPVGAGAAPGRPQRPGRRLRQARGPLPARRGLAGTAARPPPLGRRLDHGRHPDRPLAPVPVRLVDPTRQRPPLRLLGPGQPRPVRLRRPQPRRGPGPVRHRLQRRPLAGPAGHPGPPPMNVTDRQRSKP
jgi:hypothetical protein